ncbi:hypothetical protein FRC18_004203 [Serendipita sp. 400]|nr:hypothetical protein FRC18_004203 [Serendipita sp. 400]
MASCVGEEEKVKFTQDEAKAAQVNVVIVKSEKREQIAPTTSAGLPYLAWLSQTYHAKDSGCRSRRVAS